MVDFGLLFLIRSNDAILYIVRGRVFSLRYHVKEKSTYSLRTYVSLYKVQYVQAVLVIIRLSGGTSRV